MKTKIAFIKYGGICAGGTEKYIQTIAANLPKDKFEVDFYYCDGSPYIGAEYNYPPSEPERLKHLVDNGVNAIKFDVAFKNVTLAHHPWVDTNFWDVFDETKYDIVQSGRAGHAEYPFTEINETAIVDIITLPGMAEKKSNIFKTIHISEFQRDSWVNAGGNINKSMVLPLVSDLPKKGKKNLRKELGIPKDACVFGLHQREDDGIFSPVAMQAFGRLEADNVHFVIMGGSKNYGKLAEQGDIKNFTQLDHTSDPKRLDQFLNTLDVYTHARADGETFGLAIAEAMSYGTPIISHVAPAMGHVETIGDGGVVCKSGEEYVTMMNVFLADKKERLAVGAKAKKRYEEHFSVKSVVDQVVEVYDELMVKKNEVPATDEDFWGEIWDE